MMKKSKLSIVVYIVVAFTTIRFSVVGIDCWEKYKKQKIVKEVVILEVEKFLREHESYYRENVKSIQDSVAQGLLNADSAFDERRGRLPSCLHWKAGLGYKTEKSPDAYSYKTDYIQVSYDGWDKLSFALINDLGDCHAPNFSEYKDSLEFRMAQYDYRWEIRLENIWKSDKLPVRDPLREPVVVCFSLKQPRDGRCSILFENFVNAFHSTEFKSCRELK